jgi:hypothetical protein
MPRRRPRSLRPRRTLACAVLAVALAVAVAAPAGAQPLRTAVADAVAFYGPADQVREAFAHVRAAGSSFVRIYVNWASIAPATKPAGFDPRNPADPNYRFATTDLQVTLARQEGLEPILSVNAAPPWAERGRKGTQIQYPVEEPGAVNPDPVAYGDFAAALATRYGGGFGGLPRVRYFQAWNEPNLYEFLDPQYTDPPAGGSAHGVVSTRGVPQSVAIYRDLVNAFGHAVHAVHRDDKVIAGGLAPFRDPLQYEQAAPPLPFMRALLCLTPANRPIARCPKLDFDIWSHHPYTDGSPEHKALVRGDVSIPELPQMRRVLTAAARAGKISAGQRVDFWVTEIGWDSKPPSRGGVPLALHARFVSDGLYRIWQAGVSLVTWYEIHDDPTTRVVSGLFFACPRGPSCDTPKPAFTAFRFPFVAYRQRGGVLVWGRTPWGTPGRVIVEQQVRRRWRRLATLGTDRYGIFNRTLRGRFGGGDLRARLARGGSASVPFSLKVPSPTRFLNPFG